MDQMVVHRIKEFDKLHGDDPVRAGATWLIFANGATRQIHIDHACPLVPPPADPLERAKLILAYREIKHKRATDAFKDAKSALRLRANEAIRHAAANAPPPTPTAEEIAGLEVLRQAVIARQQEVDAARADVEANMPPIIKQRAARAEANRERNQAALAAIEAIEI